MPKFNMVIYHPLPQDEALRRIKGLLGEVENKFADKIGNLREDWKGNTGRFSFKVMGFSISGTIIVYPSRVELSANLPFAARFLKGKIRKIETTIRERAETLLD